MKVPWKIFPQHWIGKMLVSLLSDSNIELLRQGLTFVMFINVLPMPRVQGNTW